MKFNVHFVDEIPRDVGSEDLYICEQYGCSVHICPCGCKMKVAISLLPFWKEGWTVERNGDFVTFAPSLLNRGCNAHYFIRNSEVAWA